MIEKKEIEEIIKNSLRINPDLAGFIYVFDAIINNRKYV